MKPTRQFPMRAPRLHRFFSDGRDFQLARSCVCWGGTGKI